MSVNIPILAFSKLKGKLDIVGHILELRLIYENIG